MVRGRRHAPTMDCQDVGYSSESSVHLSNEDAAGECVRVYTYTTAEATSPRVLEVVMDGNCRPRKTPPRSPSGVEDVGRPRNLLVDGLAVADSPGPNCGFYSFCHEDSDKDHRHHGPLRHSSPGRFSSDEAEDPERDGVRWSDGDLGDEDDIQSVNSSDMDVDDSLGIPPTRLDSPDGIHKLVNQADLMVRSSRPVDCMRHVTNRQLVTGARRFGSGPLMPCVMDSCDASGEYTSSGSESDGGESTSSIQEKKGSVIHLKDGEELASLLHNRSGNVDSKPTSVKTRINKRRTIDRPKSLVESLLSTTHPSGLATYHSETALHGLQPRG